MCRELSELSLEELWELFPIFLTEPRKEWEDYYIEQEMALKTALCRFHIHRISHIGSTAIGTIWAKPIIDILIEICADEILENVAAAIIQRGFVCMSSATDRISLNCGYTKKGFAQKVYHLHLRYAGDHDELYFRDYMREHPQAAAAYEQLKLVLWREYEHDRDGYTKAKTDFIRKYTEEAKIYYPNRYEG